MRSVKKTGLVALFLSISLGSYHSFAQRAKKPVVPIVEIQLPVTVFEKGQPVSGLQKDRFRVYENGVRQKLLSATDGPANPFIYAGLIIDTSSSAAGKLNFYKEAASNFLYSLVALRKHKAALMTFDSEIVLRQDFTDKLDLLQTAVDKVKKTGPKAALYDAVWSLADQKLRKVPGRRVMVIITDGGDTFSRADLNDTIDIAQRTGTAVYAISTNTAFGSTAASENKEKYTEIARLCEQTGGVIFYVDDMLSLERSFKRILDELKYQYVLSYRPKNQKTFGSSRVVDVRMDRKSDSARYGIRARKSYRLLKAP